MASCLSFKQNSALSLISLARDRSGKCAGWLSSDCTLWKWAEVHEVVFNLCAIPCFSAKDEFRGNGAWRRKKHRRVIEVPAF